MIVTALLTHVASMTSYKAYSRVNEVTPLNTQAEKLRSSLQDHTIASYYIEYYGHGMIIMVLQYGIIIDQPFTIARPSHSISLISA